MRDRHEVRAEAVPLTEANGVVKVNVAVVNAGRRPISIKHVYFQPIGGSAGLFLSCPLRLDTGERMGATFDSPNANGVQWKSVEEVRSIRIFAVDALGKRHRAYFHKQNKFLTWLLKR